MTKILVTGSKGMLGSDLISLLSAHHDFEVTATDIEELDITRVDEVIRVLGEVSPELIFHCAAYTAVDRAEEEPDVAEQVNGLGTRNIAYWAMENQARVVYVSTDYVFDGKKSIPYSEKDRPDPLGAYGLSKLLGEVYLRTLLENHLIVRTSWLCGANGPNFVRTMLRLGAEGHELSVVDDQRGRPTFSFDLAKTLISLGLSEEVGVIHASNSGEGTWCDFAREIFMQANNTAVVVHGIPSSEYPTAAKRPANSILDLTKLHDMGLALPHWKDSLGRLLIELGATG